MKFGPLKIVLILTFFFILEGLLIVPPFGLAAEISDDPFEQATQLVVMIEGELNGAPSFGAGIIINQEKDGFTIITANHVVRRGDQNATDIRVMLKPYPDKTFPARLMEKFDSKMDLAVLRISGLDAHNIDIKNFDMKVLDQAAIERNGAVFPVGNPNGVPWGMPVVPDRVAQIVGKNITFQSAFIGAGHSGGGLVREGGVLVGMIVKDQPPFGQALQVSSIKSIVRIWGIGFGLKRVSSYETDGMWRIWDHDLFDDQLTIEVHGEKLKGAFRVKYPWKTTVGWAPDIGKIEYPTNATGGETVLSGEIKGNEITLKGTGIWRYFTKTRRLMERGGYGVYEEEKLVKFSILLHGNVFSDEISFKYEFQYPPLEEKSEGTFKAQRG